MSSFLILLPYLKDKNGNYLLDDSKIEEFNCWLNTMNTLKLIKNEIGEIDLKDIIYMNNKNDKELQKILRKKKN